MYVFELFVQCGKLIGKTVCSPALMFEQRSVLRNIEAPFETVTRKPFPETVKDTLLNVGEAGGDVRTGGGDAHKGCGSVFTGIGTAYHPAAAFPTDHQTGKRIFDRISLSDGTRGIF